MQWNFFVPGHGKSAADGHAAYLKLSIKARALEWNSVKGGKAIVEVANSLFRTRALQLPAQEKDYDGMQPRNVNVQEEVRKSYRKNKDYFRDHLVIRPKDSVEAIATSLKEDKFPKVFTFETKCVPSKIGPWVPLQLRVVKPGLGNKKRNVESEDDTKEESRGWFLFSFLFGK